ncbi:hypothetical protein ID866_4008 [Astraeus odoratus]|nr:hypothetical protein ID866_4008 [Astraeus odoratus]
MSSRKEKPSHSLVAGTTAGAIEAGSLPSQSYAGKVSPPRSLLAGLGAGMVEAIIAVTPSETIKTKLIDDAKRPNPQYRGLVHGTVSIVRQEGILGIYRGLFPVMMRQGANSAVRFTTYTTLKQFVQGTVRPGQQLSSGITFGIGAIAGLVTVYTTQPLDVIKTRMQSLTARQQYRNSFHFSVPVLETALVNLEHLVQKVASGPQAQGISGVIITSKRAVEAWGKAVESVISGDLDAVADDGVTWGSVPFYVVGEATASAAAELRTRLPSRFVSYDIRGGSQSGTAQELAHFILNDLPAGRDESPPRALLYLTGDKNRDTLPNILTSQDIVLHTLQVYATQGSSSFPRDLETALERVSAGK